ncbi:MAG: SPASM domain-containing protein [Verrucomicrobiae bacterium]|nr:SPASM domain-containing protein [Verrucomicrobiae bacterium]
MKCNLNCYYCYEPRSNDTVHPSRIPDIEEWIRLRLQTRKHRCLHVDWYGGEPMLNLQFLEAASEAIQRICYGEGVQYSASIISNGTVWPDNPGEFVKRNRIREVQISFDGLRENHVQRRRLRRNHELGGGANAFDCAVRLVDQLLDFTRVDIRLNLDCHNKRDLMPFIDFARNRGWFTRKFPGVLQVARLTSYSERSAPMRFSELSISEYEELRDRLRDRKFSDVPIEESEVPDHFPFPRTFVCAALARDSVVFGADCHLYRCGLQVGFRDRAVGYLDNSGWTPHFTDSHWWDTFDPTSIPRCASCSFLPICFGGCPLKHLRNDTSGIDDQCKYWRRNLPRLITSRFGLMPPNDFVYTESDQFR